nr:hypothetical protein [Pelobium sp.]
MIIGFLLFNHFQRRPEPFGPDDRNGDPIVKELKFDSHQEQQFIALKEEHKKRMRFLKEDTKKLRSALFATLKNTDTAGLNKDFYLQKISKDQEEIEVITFEHFKKVRAICDEQQKLRFDKMIDRIINHLMGEGPRPNPRMPHPPLREEERN